MRRLYLLRHAKSSWDDADLADFDRPLDARGERAAAAMAVYCRQIGLAPDRVLCSPSCRTRATWARLRAEIPDLPAAAFPKAAYEADRETLAGLLASAPADAASILLIGHNPGLQDLAVWLANGPKALKDALAEKLPTGALVILDIDGDDWASLGEGEAAVVEVTAPKTLL